MKKITKTDFGRTAAGEAVEQYTLENASGMRADILTYGGTIRTLHVPDKTGALRDVVLGYDTVAAYEKGDCYFGALIGRYGNRIASGKFELNGKPYSLYCNEPTNHLHGGKRGFDKRVWRAETEDGALLLHYTSPDGEENYPGTLEVTVRYRLTDGNALELTYEAVSDADTLCNLTNHSYFNLAGQGSGPMLDQQIMLLADTYLETDDASIPVRACPVDGTPMDLREPVRIGSAIDAPFPPLNRLGGYDHNWIIQGYDGSLRKFAEASDAGSGIRLGVSTTLPGVQFYAGNFVPDGMAGKDGAAYCKRAGFCLETQYFPNLFQVPGYPAAYLKKGENYHQQTVFQFDISK